MHHIIERITIKENESGLGVPWFYLEMNTGIFMITHLSHWDIFST